MDIEDMFAGGCAIVFIAGIGATLLIPVALLIYIVLHW